MIVGVFMYNFPEIFECLQRGEYAKVWEILVKPIHENKIIVLSAEDKEQLLSILLIINEQTLGLPENTSDFDRLYREAMFEFEPIAHSENFYISREILNTLNVILRRSEVHLPSDSMLIDFLVSEANQDRGFLRNVLFQEFITNYARDPSTTFFNRFIQDLGFMRRICRDICPGYFLGKENEDILTRATRWDVSAEIFDALVFHGADVNGRRQRPSFFHTPYTRQVNAHFIEPVTESRKQWFQPHRVREARLFFKNGTKSPLFEAILQGNLSHIERLLLATEIILTRDIDDVFSAIDVNDVLPECRSMSPLMLAAYLGYSDIIQALLLRGANINEVDDFGESAIFYALRANQLTVFYFLFEHGDIDITLTNHQGLSLQDLMHTFHYPAMQEIFDPKARLYHLIRNKPEFLREYILELIEAKMPVLVDGLDKDEVPSFLGRHQSQSNPFHAFFKLPSPDTFEERFLMLSKKHDIMPFISAGRANSNSNYVVVQNPADGKYQVRLNLFSFKKAQQLAMMAYFLQRLKYFPVECLLEIVSYFSTEEIFDLFESSEIASQILLSDHDSERGAGLSAPR